MHRTVSGRQRVSPIICKPLPLAGGAVVAKGKFCVPLPPLPSALILSRFQAHASWSFRRACLRHSPVECPLSSAVLVSSVAQERVHSNLRNTVQLNLYPSCISLRVFGGVKRGESKRGVREWRGAGVDRPLPAAPLAESLAT
jgi:hypothetical protein